MVSYQETALWRRTLATDSGDSELESQARERLRDAYLAMRERVTPIAERIAIDLPEFTVHDIRHLDALWCIADLIIGPSYQITALEAFVLGATFLVHDLGMGLAAYPEGIEAIKGESVWQDAVALRLRAKLGRPPSRSDIASADQQILTAAKAETLRILHARRAEQLVDIQWQLAKGSNAYFLIDSAEVRSNYGSLIGKLAHSHWWDVSQLQLAFPHKLGPGAFWELPNNWTVDPLKLACILRTADAAHLDARRAPEFERILRKPVGISEDHWGFQQKMQQPHLDGDRLVFTAARGFTANEATSWWQCLDALKTVDAELRAVDRLLADTNRPRFIAKAVAGVEDPKRLAAWIPTENWIPIDARLKVSNVSRLVDRLGGKELYGENPRAALRELIQNARDALNVRSSLDNTFSNGHAIVRLRRDNADWYLEVEDNGVGMSPGVLTGSLLDFGNSFWDSQTVLEEFPGLLSTKFTPAGKFGIGFFAVFMLGEHVTVLSKRYDAASSDVNVLEFPGGLRSRTILRKPLPTEELKHSGTLVRVKLAMQPEEAGGLLWFASAERAHSIFDICEWLCPALDVDLWVEDLTGAKQRVIVGNDWLSIPPEELLGRVNRIDENGREDPQVLKADISNFAKHVRTLQTDCGTVIGRACIIAKPHGADPGSAEGVISVNGLRANHTANAVGVLLGNALTAVRDKAVPLASNQEIARWATDQGRILQKSAISERAQMESAAVIHALGGSVSMLPICLTAKGWLNRKQFCHWAEHLDKVTIAGFYSWEYIARLTHVALEHDVAITTTYIPANFQYGNEALYQQKQSHNEEHLLSQDALLALPDPIADHWDFAKETVESILLIALTKPWKAPLGVILANLSPDKENITIGKSKRLGAVRGLATIVRRPSHLGPKQRRK